MQVSDLGLARPVGSYAWQLNIAANLCSFARKRGWTAGQDVSKRLSVSACLAVLTLWKHSWFELQLCRQPHTRRAGTQNIHMLVISLIMEGK